MISVGGGFGSTVGPGLPAAGRPPSVDAELQKYQKQLCDMVTCPSRTTAEGKAKIKDIETKIGTLKSQLKQADGKASADATPGSAGASDPSQGRSARMDGLGGRLDVWA